MLSSSSKDQDVQDVTRPGAIGRRVSQIVSRT